MARRIKIQAAAITGTAGNDTIVGSNDPEGERLEGGAGADTLDSMQGPDTLAGGEGPDLFREHSWASSNELYGIDRIEDFTSEDTIDISNLRHYSSDDMAVAVSRPVEWGDISFTPIAGGNRMRVSVTAGNPQWDLMLDVLGPQPTEANVKLS